MISFSLFADTIGSARISLLEGNVLVRTNDTGAEWLAASVNLPLMSGDKIWVPENGRSEIQFLGGSYIRADKNTGLDITKLNRVSEGDITQVAVNQGRTYVQYNESSINNSVFQVYTPLISAIAYRSAKFEVYVYEDGYTEVSVINGTVYVEGQHGNIAVNTGDMISVGTDNYAEISPRRPNDEWVSWNLSRDSYLSGAGISIKYLPATLDIYCADFDQYGHWVHTPEYGYVWSPIKTVSTWAPYKNGRWVWKNADYVWVSYEPWGWVPYHYGRWAFRVGIGWFWVPPVKQVNPSPLPLKVVQQKHLPPKTILNTKKTIGSSSRYIALNKNISVFKGSKPMSSMRVDVVKDPKSISSNQRLHLVEPGSATKVSSRVQRQQPKSTPPFSSIVYRVDPKSTKVSTQIQRQQPKSIFAQNKTNLGVRNPNMLLLWENTRSMK